MPLDFPSSPTNGQTYTSGGKTWVYNATTTSWELRSGTGYLPLSGSVMTGALGITAGTAGAPGLYVSADTNTGIFSPGADQLSIVTGGTAKITVDSNSVSIPNLNFTQTGPGAVTRTVDSKLKEVVSVKDFGAVGDGVADDTAAIQAAINSVAASGSGVVYIPRGLYLVDPAVGINVVDGLTLIGAGRNNSQLVAKPVGGTIIKRAFNLAGPNAYVSAVTIRDIGIILRHPATADPGNYYQVAIQLRHITRSLVENVYIGNYPIGISSALSRPASQADARQGYGVSIGSTSASDPAYAGGEVNTCRRVMCSGVRFGFTLDNPIFNKPGYGSAAYSTVIDCCEVSIAEVGISQYGQYGAGCTFSNNVIQAIDQMRGSSDTAYSMYIDGYEHLIYGGYNESPFTDYELFLSSSSRRNRILTWLSNGGPFDDNGIGNVYERINGTTNKWELSVNKRDYGRAFAKAWVSFYWDGSAVVINDSYGVNGVVRVGAGDYRIDLSSGAVPDVNYTVALSGNVNASSHPGSMNLRSKTTSSCRINTYNHIAAAYQDFLENTVTIFGNQ